MLLIRGILPPTFAFTDLPHHRTCGSAYGGFGLSHLTMCGKLFSAIPLGSVTSILLSDSVLSCEQRVPIGHLTTKDSQGSSHLLLHCPILPFPIGTRALGTMALLTSHDKFCSMTFVKATNHHVRETSSDKGIVFPSYTYFIYTNHSEQQQDFDL